MIAVTIGFSIATIDVKKEKKQELTLSIRSISALFASAREKLAVVCVRCEATRQGHLYNRSGSEQRLSGYHVPVASGTVAWIT